MATQIHITDQMIEAYNRLNPDARIWERDNPMAQAIREQLNPQFIWMTPDDTLIRESFVHELLYHDNEVQNWLALHRRGEQVKPITIRILNDGGIRIVKV